MCVYEVKKKPRGGAGYYNTVAPPIPEIARMPKRRTRADKSTPYLANQLKGKGRNMIGKLSVGFTTTGFIRTILIETIACSCEGCILTSMWHSYNIRALYVPPRALSRLISRGGQKVLKSVIWFEQLRHSYHPLSKCLHRIQNGLRWKYFYKTGELNIRAQIQDIGP